MSHEASRATPATSRFAAQTRENPQLCRVTWAFLSHRLLLAQPESKPTQFSNPKTPMRIPDWTPELKAQPTDLVEAILARRGGQLINLDKALLWSEPLARGWNVYLKAVRSELPTDRRLRELAICTVALLTGASYEYHHHAPDFLVFGGTQVQLDALQALLKDADSAAAGGLTAIELAVIDYAREMTVNVVVSKACFAELEAHFDTTQIVELTAAIATYNMVARFLMALEVSKEI